MHDPRTRKKAFTFKTHGENKPATIEKNESPFFNKPQPLIIGRFGVIFFMFWIAIFFLNVKRKKEREKRVLKEGTKRGNGGGGM